MTAPKNICLKGWEYLKGIRRLEVKNTERIEEGREKGGRGKK